jgi:hypothetical protein
VAAHPADLPLLVLVVVPADPARVLPLPLPHLDPFLPRPRAAAAPLLDPPREVAAGLPEGWSGRLESEEQAEQSREGDSRLYISRFFGGLGLGLD